MDNPTSAGEEVVKIGTAEELIAAELKTTYPHHDRLIDLAAEFEHGRRVTHRDDESRIESLVRFAGQFRHGCTDPNCPSRIQQLEIAFRHHHVAKYAEDRLLRDCGQCGLDLVDPVHIRAARGKLR